MRIPKWLLVVLIALPLVVAGVFGGMWWEDKHLSEDEMHAVVDDAVEDLKGEYYMDRSAPRRLLDRALEGAALRQDVPVPHVNLADSSFRDDGGSGTLTYAYDIATSDLGTGVCVNFVQQPGGSEPRRGMYKVSQTDGACPESK